MRRLIFLGFAGFFVFVEGMGFARYLGLTYRKSSASPGRDGIPSFSMVKYFVVRSK